MDACIERVVELRDMDGRPCGTYHYDDPYKSFFRGLFTPRGHNVVAVPPPDHPHHKGLQYGLCTKDVNFWEEKAAPPGLPAVVGRQQTNSLELLRRGDEVGFSQELVWRDDVKESFQETRTISVRSVPAAYVWTWQTRLTATRDVVLIKGPWAARCKNGSVGYYGLGLRLASALFTEASQLFVNDEEHMAIDAGLGLVAQRVALQGAGVQVVFEQRQEEPLYLYAGDFAFMSLGPVATTLTERALAKGESLEEHYVITVGDLPAAVGTGPGHQVRSSGEFRS